MTLEVLILFGHSKRGTKADRYREIEGSHLDVLQYTCIIDDKQFTHRSVVRHDS